MSLGDSILYSHFVVDVFVLVSPNSCANSIIASRPMMIRLSNRENAGLGFRSSLAAELATVGCGASGAGAGGGGGSGFALWISPRVPHFRHLAARPTYSSGASCVCEQFGQTKTAMINRCGYGWKGELLPVNWKQTKCLERGGGGRDSGNRILAGTLRVVEQSLCESVIRWHRLRILVCAREVSGKSSGVDLAVAKIGDASPMGQHSMAV
jgi:hypothetical protein